MRIGTRLGITRATLTVVVVAAVMAAPSSSGAARGDPFRSVDEAVRAGVVNAAVADQLRAAGSVEAMVTLDRTTATRRAASAQAATKDTAASIEAYEAALAPAKSEIAALVEEVLHHYAHLGVLHVRFTAEDQVLRVANRPATTSVLPNLQYSSTLTESLDVINQPAAVAAGGTGAGVYVAVLDTGVDYTRPAFGSCPTAGAPGCRVVALQEVAPNDGFLDDNGHGTNVSGIVAGTAPGAGLFVYDVFNPAGSASGSVLATAIDRVIANRKAGWNIRALNLSLSAKPPACFTADPLGIGDAVAAGILPLVAAGNDASSTAIGDPACLSQSVAVGATYDANVGPVEYSVCLDPTTEVDRIACFSNSGPELDVLAPGVIITAAGVTQGGTSQAAPHVAGAAAIVAQEVPFATVDDLRVAVTTSGPVITDPRNDLALHRLDVRDATLRPFERVGGAATSSPDAVSVPGPTTDREVYARGGDNALWGRGSNGVVWGPWVSLGGVLSSGPSVTSPAVGVVDVFARGVDNALWHRRRALGAWGPWESLGGILTSDPEATATGPDQLVVFAKGTDEALWMRSFVGTTWSGWETLGGTLATGPGAVASSVTQLDVVARGTDWALWRKTRVEGVWSNWASLGGQLVGDADLAAREPDVLDAFATGLDGALWTIHLAAGVWPTWSRLGGALIAGPGAVGTDADRVDVFFTGSDAAIYHKWWDGTSW